MDTKACGPEHVQASHPADVDGSRVAARVVTARAALLVWRRPWPLARCGSQRRPAPLGQHASAARQAGGRRAKRQGTRAGSAYVCLLCGSLRLEPRSQLAPGNGLWVKGRAEIVGIKAPRSAERCVRRRAECRVVVVRSRVEHLQRRSPPAADWPGLSFRKGGRRSGGGGACDGRASGGAGERGRGQAAVRHLCEVWAVGWWRD